MRRYITLSFAFALAGCAAREVSAPEPAPAPIVSPPVNQTGLGGLTAQDLVVRFGNPVLQVREGASVKLQFRGARCVLDAYLYPSGSTGALRVTHVDTRSPSGATTDQAACIFALRRTAS